MPDATCACTQCGSDTSPSFNAAVTSSYPFITLTFRLIFCVISPLQRLRRMDFYYMTGYLLLEDLGGYWKSGTGVPGE